MPREHEVTLDELRKIMKEGGAYFSWKPRDEIDALNYIRLEMEMVLQKRQREAQLLQLAGLPPNG
jgi:hypothetical protein